MKRIHPCRRRTLRYVALRSACILNNQGNSAPLLSIHPSALPQWNGILRRNHSPSPSMCCCSASQAPPGGMTSLRVDEDAARPMAGRQLPPYFSRPKRSFSFPPIGWRGGKPIGGGGWRWRSVPGDEWSLAFWSAGNLQEGAWGGISRRSAESHLLFVVFVVLVVWWRCRFALLVRFRCRHFGRCDGPGCSWWDDEVRCWSWLSHNSFECSSIPWCRCRQSWCWWIFVS
jgi:hypothetical protein